MKRDLSYGGLLVMILPLSVSCSSLTLKVKDTRPTNDQPQNTQTAQAVLTAVHTTLGKKPSSFVRLIKRYKGKLSALLGLLWLWFLARFYTNEKRRRLPGWSFDDLALLKAIKDNATRLWHNHRPDRKIIRLEEWRE